LILVQLLDTIANLIATLWAPHCTNSINGNNKVFNFVSSPCDLVLLLLLLLLLLLPLYHTRRQALKQVQWALSYPNRQLGQPFLQGNFAPQLNENFTQNLPLLTAAGLAAGPPAKAAASKAAAAAAAAAAAGIGSNAVQYAAASNGHTNGHANGHTYGFGNGVEDTAAAAAGAAANDVDDDDTKQQLDTSVSRLNGTSHSSNSSSSKLHGSLDKLPAGLVGVFLRVGPNPLLKPLGGYHW
jgi:hypothetical protein